MSSRTRDWVKGSIWLCAGLPALGCLPGCHHPQAPAAAPPQVQAYTVETYAPGDNDTLRYSGSVTPATETPVAFKVGGYIDKIGLERGGNLIQEGDSVAKGTILARVRQQEYSVKVREASSGLGASEAGAEQARGKLDEARALRDQAVQAEAEAQAARFGATSEIDEATSSLAAARADVQEARSGRSQAEALVVEARAASDKASADFKRAEWLFSRRSLTKPEYESARAQRDATKARLDAANDQVSEAGSRISAAQAQVSTVQAKIAGARARLAASQSRITEAQARVQAASAGISQAAAAVDAARHGVSAAGDQVAEASLPLSDTELRSPMDGIVLKRSIEIGSLVGPGTVGFVLADVHKVKVVFGAPDSEVRRLSDGQAISFTCDGVPDATFTGHITCISPAADIKSRVFDVEVTVENYSGRLHAGMIASLMIPGNPGLSPMPTVPLSAIVRSPNSPDGYAVMVVSTEGGVRKVRRRNVRIGPVFGNRIGLIAGIQPGEQVVATGPGFLTDGQVVQVAE